MKFYWSHFNPIIKFNETFLFPLSKNWEIPYTVGPTVCPKMLVTFLRYLFDKMSAYAEPTHLIFGSMKYTGSIFHFT